MCLCFYGQHNRILFGLCLEGFLNTTYLHTFFCMISNSVSGSENMKELDWKNSWTWGKKLGIPLVKECGYLNATCNQQRHQCGFSPGNSFRAQCYRNSYLPVYFLYCKTTSSDTKWIQESTFYSKNWGQYFAIYTGNIRSAMIHRVALWKKCNEISINIIINFGVGISTLICLVYISR